MVELEIKQGEYCTFMRAGNSIKKYVPLSSEALVIVPSNIKGTGFLRNTYDLNHEFIGGLLNREEFNEVIDKASKMTAMVYSHNRHKDVEGVSKPVVHALGFSTVLFLCYIFLMYYGIRDNNE